MGLLRLHPDHPETLLQHLGGIIGSGPKEPKEEITRWNVRDIRYPEDLGVFSHPSCWPRITLPEQLQNEIAKLMADAIMAHYPKTEEKWARESFR